jgi:hypothetical protein
MILASVFRLYALVAGCFLGESGRRTVPSLAAIAVEPGHIGQGDSSGIWITKNRFRRSLAAQSDQRFAPACA